MNNTPKHNEQMLIDDAARFFEDPYGFVMYAYEWGKGELEGFSGPFEWQKRFLVSWGEEIKKNGFDGIIPVKAIRKARASGHGIGKSALTGWIVDFIMVTRPYCKGTITANTSTQLETKTWAEIAKWTKRCIFGHWFTVTTGRGSMKMYHTEKHVNGKDSKAEWFCTAQTCREENSEAFAGQHAVTSTSFYIFDEGSAVPDGIYVVAEGGLTDGEPMMFIFGNPTRNQGVFKECFDGMRHRWETEQIDSREVPITNKPQIEEWIDDYGEDSDFVRVRVKGEFPRAGAMQFIPSDIINAAAGKSIHVSQYIDRPKILGVDIARFGDDMTVFIYRQGIAAYGLKKFRGLGSLAVAGKIAEEINKQDPDAVFLDMGNTGAAIYDILIDWGYDVTGVWFGGEATDKSTYFNKRAEMYGDIRDWLRDGGAIPNDPDLKTDLAGPEYGFTSKEQIQLESKKDMKARRLASPDCADALVLTKAYPVAKKTDKLSRRKREPQAKMDYDLFSKNSPLDYGGKRSQKTVMDYDLFGYNQ